MAKQKDINYQIKFWQLRKELQDKAIYNVISEMCKYQIVSYEDNLTDLRLKLTGRVDDYDFLDKLEQLNNVID